MLFYSFLDKISPHSHIKWHFDFVHFTFIHKIPFHRFPVEYLIKNRANLSPLCITVSESNCLPFIFVATERHQNPNCSNDIVPLQKIRIEDKCGQHRHKTFSIIYFFFVSFSFKLQFGFYTLSHSQSVIIQIDSSYDCIWYLRKKNGIRIWWSVFCVGTSRRKMKKIVILCRINRLINSVCSILFERPIYLLSQ